MNVKDIAKEVFMAILPITLLITILNFAFIRLPLEIFIDFVGGTFLIIIGFILFQLGLKIGLLPVGEMIGSKLVSKGKLWIMILFGFVEGFVVTFAEPDVLFFASQVGDVSGGVIDKNVIITVISLGVAIFLLIALIRIFLKIKMIYLLFGGYALVFILAFFSTPEFLAISFDAGGVTTGPMTVPFIISLGVGVAAVKPKSKESSDAFGLVALSSIGPIIAILALGIIYK